MRHAHALLATSLAAGACADGAADDDPIPATLRDRLAAEAIDFEIPPSPGAISIEVGQRRHGAWTYARVGLDVLGGHATLSVGEDGVPWVDELVVHLADVAIAPFDVPPLELIDVVVRGQAPRPCLDHDWAGDLQRCDATVELALALDWALRTADGDVAPLATQILAPMGFAVAVADPGGADAEVAFGVAQAGTVWAWADLIRLEDPVVMITGHEHAPVE
jgi:hypothetical protein